MQRFTDLSVWRRGHQLALAVYRETRHYPNEERFELRSQVRRAAVSVAANIAEGSKRASPKDYAHFLNMSEGSLAETEYLLMISSDLRFLSQQRAADLIRECREIGGMLFSLRRAVESQVDRR